MPATEVPTYQIHEFFRSWIGISVGVATWKPVPVFLRLKFHALCPRAER